MAQIESLNEQNLGVQIDLGTSPKKMFLKCDEKACEVQDEKGKIVNQICIFKMMSVDQKRINQLLKEEEAERIRKEKEQRIFEAKQKKECPGLYQMMLVIQQYGTRVPSVAIKTARRFEELNCGAYINQQLYQ